MKTDRVEFKNDGLYPNGDNKYFHLYARDK